MKQQLTSEEFEFVEKTKVFCKAQVAPHAASWEKERRMPLETLRLAAELGLTKMCIPKEHGGFDFSFFLFLEIAELISRDCMAFAFSLINTQNVAAKIIQDGNQEQIERYVPALLKAERFGSSALTEPHAGSDFSAISTFAQKVEGGWILNGEKAWITNAAVSDVIILYAQTDPALKWQGIACFLIDGEQDQFERLPPFELMGGHAIGTGGFRLNQYFAKDSDLLQPPGKAFKTAMESINRARTYVAAMCCGMLDQALNCVVSYGKNRKIFDKSLLEHQGLKWRLADIFTELEAARLLVRNAAEAIESGQDAMIPAAHAKKFAAQITVARIADCIQSMGAEGLKEQYPLGRHINCAKIAGFVDGSTEIQNERLADALIKQYS